MQAWNLPWILNESNCSNTVQGLPEAGGDLSVARISNFKIKALCDSNLIDRIDRALFPPFYIRVSIIHVFLAPQTSEMEIGNALQIVIYEVQIPSAFHCERLYIFLPFKIFWDLSLCLSSSTGFRHCTDTCTPETHIRPIILTHMHGMLYTRCDYLVLNGSLAFLLYQQFSNQQRPLWPS